MLTLSSTAVGEWPTGVHWTPGETRELDLVGATPPAWLSPAAGRDVSVIEERHPLRPDGSVATQDNDVPVRHHKDSSRCVDPRCARAHTFPRRTA